MILDSHYAFEAQASFNQSFSVASSQSCLKRPRSEECEEYEAGDGCEEMEVGEVNELVNKKQKNSVKASTSEVSKRPDMNFPLPQEEGVAAIVKVCVHKGSTADLWL